MGNCHWHWVKAKSCDVVQAHKSCTHRIRTPWCNAITFTRMRSFLLARTCTPPAGFVGLTISRNATKLFRLVPFCATFYDFPLLRTGGEGRGGLSSYLSFSLFLFSRFATDNSTLLSSTIAVGSWSTNRCVHHCVADCLTSSVQVCDCPKS